MIKLPSGLGCSLSIGNGYSFYPGDSCSFRDYGYGYYTHSHGNAGGYGYGLSFCDGYGKYPYNIVIITNE